MNPAGTRWSRFAERWELRQRVVLPVVTSVITASIFFVGAVMLAPTIRRLVVPPGVPGFPLACLVEPSNVPGSDTVRADVLLINLSTQRQDESSLRDILERNGSGRGLQPDIVVEARHPFKPDVAIVRIMEDSAYNAGKGSVHHRSLGTNRTAFHVDSLDGRVAMRFVVVTDMELHIGSRSNQGSNPVHCESQYRFQ